MEGIYQNYPIYQFAVDRAWSYRGQKLNQSIWYVIALIDPGGP